MKKLYSTANRIKHLFGWSSNNPCLFANKTDYITTTHRDFRGAIVVFCCICAIVFGVTLLTKAGTVITTSIGEDISTNDLAVAGNANVTGSLDIGGEMQAQSIDGIKYVSQFPGADAGAKIAACFASLPTTGGGTCDARGMEGEQSASATIAVPEKTTLLLGSITLTLSGTPGMTYSTGSRIIGTKTTLLQSDLSNGSIVASSDPATRLYRVFMEDLTIKSNGSNAILLDLTNHSAGSFSRIYLRGAGKEHGGTGILISGTAFYNEFYSVVFQSNYLSCDIDNGANENKFFGGRANDGAIGFRLGYSSLVDNNVFITPAIELMTVNNIEFGIYSKASKFIAPRLESPGIPFVTNNATSATNIVEYPFVVGAGTPFVDPNNTLTFGTTNLQIGTQTLHSASAAKLVIQSGSTGSPTVRSNIELKNDTDTQARGIFYSAVDDMGVWFNGIRSDGDAWQVGYDSTGGASYEASSSLLSINKAGSMGVGTSSPASTAQLDVSSTAKGFLPPRMTTAQRDAISAPAEGLMIYNLTTHKMNFYNGTGWEQMTSA